MGWPIDMERMGRESIGCRTHFVTLNFDLPHDFDLGFSRSNLNCPYLRNVSVDLHGMKGVWFDKMLDLLLTSSYDLDPGFHD